MLARRRVLGASLEGLEAGPACSIKSLCTGGAFYYNQDITNNLSLNSWE